MPNRAEHSDDDQLWWVLGADHPNRPTRSSSSGSVLAAAMIAVGEILEPDKVRVEITQEAPSDRGDDEPFTLDFGTLPPLS